MTGRPSEYSEETADEICERLSNGESLRSICRDDAMPANSTVCRWLAQNEDFRKRYAHARELQADALFDESLDIADNAHESQSGAEPDVQRDRLRIDTRKWMAGKLNAKRYGDKTLYGSDPDNPLPSPNVNVFYRDRDAG